MTKEEKEELLSKIWDMPKPKDDSNYWQGVDDVADLISNMPITEREKGTLEDIKAEINNLDFGFVDEEYKAGISYAAMKFNQMIDERMTDVKGSNNCATWKYSREKRKMCCSRCGFDTLYLGKFCSNCGEDMRGERE